LTALAEEPLALTQLAARGGNSSSAAGSGANSGSANSNSSSDGSSAELAALAKQILSRVTWPGKPEPPGPVVTPLTAAEEKRYAAGAEIYNNICVNCHQPDGRGKEKLAPALAGSTYALANPGVPIRVLLAGKEGDIGLMPPLAALPDDQIAAVLTYVRRSWGNAASAVDAPAVKEIRGLTASHKRPWTAAELARLVSIERPGGG
jgi:mono/diheme cytochrome c family protein